MAAPHLAGEAAAEHVVVREAERERERQNAAAPPLHLNLISLPPS